jgi:ABC-type amino acid transport substrate-binding protein
MNRAAVLVLLAALPAVPVSADLAELKAAGVIKVIAQKDEAPEMFNYSAGEPGFEREMVEGFARLHGLKVEPVAVATSADRIPALNRGAGDLIIGIVDLPERRRLVSFSVEVIPVRHMAVSRKPGPAIETVEALRAARVGTVRNTSWATEALAAGVKADELQLFADRNEVFAALREGRITATVITLSDGILAMRADPALQAGVFLGEQGVSAFAIRKSDTQLLAALDEYLGNFRKSPSWNRLVVKYFGDQALKVLGRR